MTYSRLIDDHTPYSGLEELIACQNKAIEQTILSKIIADDAVKPFFPLEAALAMYGRTEALRELWKRSSDNLKTNFNPALGFYFAKRFNHPELVTAYLNSFQRNDTNYMLQDGKTPASLHKAAYFSKEAIKPTDKDVILESLKSLKKKADDKDKNNESQSHLITALSSFDQFDELPLHSAIAGGNKNLVEFLFVETPQKLYDLPELIIRILDSRNTRLAPIFMNKLVERYRNEGELLFKRYGALERFNETLFKIAMNNNEINPGQSIKTLLFSISDQKARRQWIKFFRETALLLAFEDIFITLVRECPIDDAPLYKQISDLFILSENFSSQKAHLSLLVVKAFLPLIEETPLLIHDTIRRLFSHDGLNNLIDPLTTKTLFLSCISDKNKKEHFAAISQPYIDNRLQEQGIKIHYNDLDATYKLFNIIKLKKPLTELTPILQQYIASFENSKGSATGFFYAAHVAFLLNHYSLARSWYEKCLEMTDNSKDGIILTAYKIITRQILVLFEDLHLDLPAHFIETYKNNLFSLMNDDTLTFSLVMNAILFATNIGKKDLTFKQIYDHICEINDQFTLYKNSNETESWPMLYAVRQASLAIDQLYAILLNPTKKLDVKPEAGSIAEAKENLALTQLARNNFSFSHELIVRLGGSSTVSTKLSNLDDRLMILSSLISAASENLATISAEKAKKRAEAEKNHQIKLAIKKISSQSKKKSTQKNVAAEGRPSTTPAFTHSLNPEQAPDIKIERPINEPESTIDAEAHESKLKRIKYERALEKEIEEALKEEEDAIAEEARRAEEAKKAFKPELKVAIEAIMNTEPTEMEAIAPQHEKPTPPTQQTPSTQHQLIQPLLSLQISPIATTYRTENPIYTHARELNLPRVVGMLFEKYENRISLTGGAVRDTYLNLKKPYDYDFVLFGTEHEVMRDFPAAIMHKGKHSISFNLLIDEIKIDIKLLPPVRSNDEKIAMLKAEASTRDFTVNALHRIITRDSAILHDFFNGYQHLGHRILAMPNEKDAIGIFLLYPDRYFRLLYLNCFLQFNLSAGVIDNIRKIHEAPNAFIQQCTKMQSAIRRQINKMIEHYGRHFTYQVIVSYQLTNILTESGVLSIEQIKELESAFAMHRMGFFSPREDQRTRAATPLTSPKI